MTASRFETLEGRQLLAASGVYVKTNLVSNDGAGGTAVDAGLVNGWGLAANANGPWWVGAADSGLSTAYDANGLKAAADVHVPGAPGRGDGHPTGVVATAKGFAIGDGQTRGPSQYVFVTEDGTISGWTPSVDGTHAILKVNRSTKGAVYKGAAIAARAGARYLFAADFHNKRIDVFDAHFKAVAQKANAFKDSNLPAGYSPFNVAAVGDKLFVTFALQDGAGTGDVAGAGHGFVDVFKTDGTLVKRFASGGTLNSPWAVVKAPASFGKYAGHILVGNFGSGNIGVYGAKGKFRGLLRGQSAPLHVDGLWGLAFGNGSTAGPKSALFFAAGPNDEADGLFGKITVDGSVGGTGGGGGFPY